MWKGHFQDSNSALYFKWERGQLKSISPSISAALTYVYKQQIAMRYQHKAGWDVEADIFDMHHTQLLSQLS